MNTPTQRAIEIAAQIWTQPDTSHITMDTQLAMAFARKLDELGMSSIIDPVEPKTGFELGLNVEHILLSVTIVSTKEGAGQFDDSCASQLKKAMEEYHGVVYVDANVLYQHSKVEQHSNGCQCGKCRP